MEALDNLKTLVGERTRRIVVWCGAGLSFPAGIPTWQLLRRKLEVQLEQQFQSLDMKPDECEGRIRSVRSERNLWVAFQRLQHELGDTTFREVIRGQLAPAVTVDPPDAYKALWDLRPHGIINLNLDKLATRAYLELGLPPARLIEFKGKELADYASSVAGPRTFLCNIHGVEEDFSSWVFTKAKLALLFETPGYNEFLTTILLSSTVIFLGLSAEDVAVGGHLERLKNLGIETPTHFWITDRTDVETNQWAEDNGIRIIRYRPSRSDHPELSRLLRDIATAVPKEDTVFAPVVPATKKLDTIPAPRDLQALDPEKIRELLNARAASILQEDTPQSREKYEAFSRDYDRAIHQAWYTSTDDQGSEFFDYRLLSEIARGAFGLVYQSVSKHGQMVAIKLLHNEIRRKNDLLNAFRRGVRSMRILKSRGIPGMVDLLEAFEIPACVVMEWIDGPNLKEVGESRTLVDWQAYFDIVVQLTRIILAAHQLPERVLHRDLRPANVMVEGYWERDYKVKVLDFDLSWHQGAAERSVVHGSSMSGYLAPEQLERRVGVSTQNALVDSFGLGMTMFFLLSLRNPLPGEHLHRTWEQDVERAAQRLERPVWWSVPRRVSRLIIQCTHDQQSRRWDMAQIYAEVARLFAAIQDPSSVKSAELVAEEIAARSEMMRGYTWDDSLLSATRDFGTGLVVRLQGNETRRTVEVYMERQQTSADNRNRLAQNINRARDEVMAALTTTWNTKADVGQGMLTVRASLDVDQLRGAFDRLAQSLDAACERMRFG